MVLYNHVPTSNDNRKEVRHLNWLERRYGIYTSKSRSRERSKSLATTPFRCGARAWAWCSGTETDIVQTRQCPELKLFISNLEKVLTIEKSAANSLCESKYRRHW